MNDLIRQEKPQSWLKPQSVTQAMELAQIMAKSEDMCPKAYRDKPNAIFMAMVKAEELGLHTMTVMDNMYPIEGSLSWKSTFLIQYANSSGMIKGVIKYRWETKGKIKIPGRAAVPYQAADPNAGRRFPTKAKPEFKERELDNIHCTAYATLADGTEIEGPTISVDTALRAGWVYNNPEQWLGDTQNMLYQRAAKRFCNMYGIGINELSQEEIRDSEPMQSEYTEAVVVETTTPRKPKPAPSTAATPTHVVTITEAVTIDDGFETAKELQRQLAAGDAEWTAAIDAATSVEELEKVQREYDL